MANPFLLPTLILAVLPTLATAQRLASFAELPQRLNVGDAVTVDALIRTHKTVYQAPPVSARLSLAPGRQQVSVELRW